MTQNNSGFPRPPEPLVPPAVTAHHSWHLRATPTFNLEHHGLSLSDFRCYLIESDRTISFVFSSQLPTGWL